jgi:HSP20 family protein
MSITRWDPFGDLVSLREAMNNLLEESFVRGPGSEAGATGRGGPAGLAVDVRETPEAFTVTASVPGLKPEDVEISVLGDTLRIGGQRREEQDAQTQGDGNRWIIRERRFGAFERTIRLPTTVRSGDADAEFKDGVLTVTLPKADEARPRSIPIRAGQAQAGQPQPIDVGGGASQDAPKPAGQQS